MDHFTIPEFMSGSLHLPLRECSVNLRLRQETVRRYLRRGEDSDDIEYQLDAMELRLLCD